MDPWSKVDYPRIIREASMMDEKLPEVIPPSGRVPTRVLLALPILEARRRWNRGEIEKKGSLFGRIPSRRIYIGEGGQPGGLPGAQAPTGAARPKAAPGGLLGPWWWPS